MLKSINYLIDSESELNAITSYITQTWDGFETPESKELFKKIWNESNKLLKHQFDQHVFLDFIKIFYKIKESLDIHINGVNSKEFPMHFIISNSALHDTVENSFNYEKSVKNMLSDIVTEISDVKNIRPKGWNNLSENYEEYIGINEIDYKNLKKLFTGIDSATASSLSFEVRTSLPHVMYDYKSQARKPLEVLVGAILAHSFAMNEKNNSVKMLSEWQELESQLKENLNEDINFDFTEPLNKALVDVIKNQGEIKNSTLQILSLNKKTLRNYY